MLSKDSKEIVNLPLQQWLRWTMLARKYKENLKPIQSVNPNNVEQGGGKVSINSTVLRLTWSVIEETPSSQLLTLTDTALVKLIMQKIARQILLTGDEVCALYEYIGSKMALIRDIAESRLIQARSLEPSAS